MSTEDAARLRHHTAVHEAGHAVIGRAVTMACGGATILSDDSLGSTGCAIVASADTTWHEWLLREKIRDLGSAVRGRIITVQAGSEAEAEVLGTASVGDEDDHAAASAMAEDLNLPPEAEQAVLDRLRRAARQLVRRHRADIEKIARMLMARGTLTGEEIDAVLPPGFMARPVTLEIALATDVEDCGSLAEAVGRLSGPGAQ